GSLTKYPSPNPCSERGRKVTSRGGELPPRPAGTSRSNQWASDAAWPPWGGSRGELRGVCEGIVLYTGAPSVGTARSGSRRTGRGLPAREGQRIASRVPGHEKPSEGARDLAGGIDRARGGGWRWQGQSHPRARLRASSSGRGGWSCGGTTAWSCA